MYGAGENLLLRGSAAALPPEVRALSGRVQCVYLDPPFMTGDVFQRKRPYGEKGWRKGTPAVTLPGYADRFPDEEAYLSLLGAMVENARTLLYREGVFCLHLDWRMSARARLLCDRVFGRENFLNEIIWAYESGGRSKKFFPRKHDTLLLYAAGPGYHFDLTRVPLSRGENRKNHMARKVDENGRTYSSIVSGGREYRYYDDDPVYPGDVWADIGFLQQKDPERTGYPTQKPLKLLERVLLPVTRPGDWVADLCCGSGTTLAEAERLDCHYLGMDQNPEAIAVSLARLEAENLSVFCPTSAEEAPLHAQIRTPEYSDREAEPRPIERHTQLSFLEEDLPDPSFSLPPIESIPQAPAAFLTLEGLDLAGGIWPPDVPSFDFIESWETGRVSGDVFFCEKRFRRTFAEPGLPTRIPIDPDNPPDLMITDASGARRCWRWTI